MENSFQEQFEQAVKEHENQEVTFEHAPKEKVKQAVKEVMAAHQKTIKELADR